MADINPPLSEAQAERAAIMEFDGNLPRPEAERRARGEFPLPFLADGSPHPEYCTGAERTEALRRLDALSRNPPPRRAPDVQESAQAPAQARKPERPPCPLEGCELCDLTPCNDPPRKRRELIGE